MDFATRAAPLLNRVDRFRLRRSCLSDGLSECRMPQSAKASHGRRGWASEHHPLWTARCAWYATRHWRVSLSTGSYAWLGLGYRADHVSAAAVLHPRDDDW